MFIDVCYNMLLTVGKGSTVPASDKPINCLAAGMLR